MKIFCLKCGRSISASQIGLQKKWVKCEPCNEIFDLQSLLSETERRERIGKVSDTPPENGMLKVEQFQNEIKITLPPSSLKSQLPLMGFAGFWIGFVTFWTWGASQGSLWFAALSAPFWFAGLAMWGAILNNLIGSEAIILRKGEIELRKDRLPRPYRAVVPLSSIGGIKFESKSFKGFVIATSQSNKTYKEGLVIHHGAKEEVFFQGISRKEGEWLHGYIEKMSENPALFLEKSGEVSPSEDVHDEGEALDTHIDEDMDMDIG